MILRVFLLLLLVFVTNVKLQQCAKCRNRLDTGDIATYDLIREFHLSESEQFDPIVGSIPSQYAYRLHSESNLTRYTYDVLALGIPYHFWFESTFRSQLTDEQPWYLFHITDANGVTQISISFDSTQQLIGIGLPDILGNVQRVFFHHSKVFDHSWHKIFLSVVKDQVQLWIDCQQVTGIRGDFIESLLPRRKFETNGHTYISRYVDETNFFTQTTPLIDIQWMVLGCESTRPSNPNCEELPQYQESVRTESPVVQPVYVEPTTTPTVKQECPIQCPRGAAGRDGFNGEKGEKGDRGEPGLIITRTEGETHNFGELEIREICSNVVKEQLAELKPNTIGAVGPPGPPGRNGRIGKPGLKGEPGENGLNGEKGDKGDRGEDGIGRSGPAGPQGIPGMPGLDGNSGRAGERGEDGRNGSPGLRGEPGQCPSDCYYTQMYMQQLQAAQAQQQQSKGPTPLNLNFKG